MPFGFLVTFACLYIAEQVRAKYRLPFYKAAAMYALPVVLIPAIVGLAAQVIVRSASVSEVGPILLDWSFVAQLLLQYAVACGVFVLLDRYEDTIAAWLTVFVGGFLILEYVI